MKKLLLSGLNAHTDRILHEVKRAGIYEVIGIVDSVKSPDSHANGLPVYSLAEAANVFGTKEASIFAAAGNAYLNQDRLAAYMACKQAGFTVVSIASLGVNIAEGIKLRENVFIDEHVRILPQANIGANSWIMRNAEIGSGARIGSSCWISAGCSIGDNATLGKNCTLAEGVIIKAGVSLPTWTTINQPMIIEATLDRPLFIDPLFRSPVTLYESN